MVEHGSSFSIKAAAANCAVSMRSRAARFLKFSKSAVVRSSRSQFSSARAARVLSSSICSGVSPAATGATVLANPAAAGAEISVLLVFGSAFSCCRVPRQSARGVKLDDFSPTGNPK